MLSRLFLEGLAAAFEARELQFFADLAHLNEAKAFAATLVALRRTEWVVYAKKTFAGPKQLLAYLARYTHRVAITNNRLLDLDETHVRLAAPDYRIWGHKLFVEKCSICHGEKGDGHGSRRMGMNPPPADLTMPTWSDAANAAQPFA